MLVADVLHTSTRALGARGTSAINMLTIKPCFRLSKGVSKEEHEIMKKNMT
jgi:hypothetical protein